MAGHSKWANIKHRKAAQDARKGRLFTRLIRELTTAARVGGGEAADNPRLRMAVEKAAAANLPKSTIDRAILRGSGELAGAGLQECVYEGYGPGGSAILVDACTDNRNRTVASVRHAFATHGGNLGTDGSVAYLFARKGHLLLESQDEEQVMMVAEAEGAEDIEPTDDGFLLICRPEQLGSLLLQADRANLKVAASHIQPIPSVWVEPDEEDMASLESLLEDLSALEDVQEVHCNVRAVSAEAAAD